MVEVKIPAEIKAYKSKLIAGLSVRQILAIGGALAICVLLGVFGYGHIDFDTLTWIIILIVAPFAGWGFMSFKDMKFEEFMKAFLEFNFFPQRRVYEDTDVNFFYDLQEEIISLDVTQQRIDNGEIEED